MKIESVKFVTPDKVVTNNDILNIIEDHSKDIFEGNFDTALNSISYMLDNIGCKNRYWMGDQKPLDLMVKAAEAAFDESGYSPGDIDVLIFCGIARGFLEPADSYFIAEALGMDKVDCFDVMDACMAWTRSTDIIESFFKSGRYRTAMIINAENSYMEGGIAYPTNFQLKNFRSIEYCFSAFCGGDGATATILSAGGEDWDRNYLSTKTGADLCTIPLKGYEGRCLNTELMALNGLGSFTSFSSRVFSNYQYMIDILEKISPHFDDIKAIYAHTGGDVNAHEKWAEIVGCKGKVKYLFPDFGNIATCSMPASMAVDIEKGELKRGDKIGCWVASSGLSFSSYVLTY